MCKWRVNLILLSVFICGLVIIGRLFYIQVIQGDYYKAMVQGMYVSDEEFLRERGEIFFQKGEPMAININFPLVYASSREVENKEETAQKLSDIIAVDKEVILEQLKKDSLYEVVKKKLSEEEVKKIKELKLAGIYFGEEKGRYYPQETLASQLAGFLDADRKGRYGLEGYYDNILKGKKEQKGNDLFLTVDYSIQFTAERLLADAAKNLKIEGGEIIVMDPKSGKILALANFPNYNPNQYSKVDDMDLFQNSATQKLFEPGSVFKPITMASAIDKGKVTPQTKYTDYGVLKIGGSTVTNYGNRIWGEKTMTEVLENSINTGAVFAEQQLGNTLFLKYVDSFGLFEPTGIDIDETYSENKEFKKGYEINFANASFGQGIAMTSMQLIRAYSVIINNGKIVKPYIVEKINNNGEITETKPFVADDIIISPKTASQVVSMLVSVVGNSYSKAAQVPGYYVAGKTGTAQISYSALEINKRGYSEKTWQSFIGFAPAYNPRFVILVKLDNPEAKTAEYSAIPIFHDLAKYIIDYYQIPSDYSEEK
ncbi:MAG: penicillin-binding protein 2 [Candidatus Nealsonbacteria bacterium]|nr:penicillin-binding protein 2 [Candidatus Nealsonbacteria bacterium]